MRRASTVLAYVRVSTDEQSVSGLGLADQRATIAREAERRGWDDVVVLADEGYSAKNLSRPGITEALERLARGDAALLVVSKLDRLSRSLLDFALLMERARRESWELVVLDLAIDTTTPSGQLMANVMAAFAEYERKLIGQRTSNALQQKKAQGMRLGRPTSVPDHVRQRVTVLRASGTTLASIAATLNEERVPTGQGGRCWYPATVAALLRSVALDEETRAVRESA